MPTPGRPRGSGLPSTSSSAADWAGPAWKRTSPASSARSSLSTRMCFFPEDEGGASEAGATSGKRAGVGRRVDSDATNVRQDGRNWDAEGEEERARTQGSDPGARGETGRPFKGMGRGPFEMEAGLILVGGVYGTRGRGREEPG